MKRGRARGVRVPARGLSVPASRQVLCCCQRQPAMTSDWPVILAFIVDTALPNAPATPHRCTQNSERFRPIPSLTHVRTFTHHHCTNAAPRRPQPTPPPCRPPPLITRAKTRQSRTSRSCSASALGGEYLPPATGACACLPVQLQPAVSQRRQGGEQAAVRL